MKEHVLHGYYRTYIENGILKYLISSTYCVFFFFYNYKKHLELKQKLTIKLGGKKMKNTNIIHN